MRVAPEVGIVPKSRARTRVDPVTLEIIQGTVESIRKEMEFQVERTARSVIIRERREYRAAIFDHRGENVSSASAAACIDPIHATYARDEIRPGDVFIWNDPYHAQGGITHLPDICITQPVFHQGEIAGYVQVFGHVLDIGGIVSGSMEIGATEIFQEGLRIPPVKVYDAGRLVEPLYRTIINNSRFPEDLRGDLDAEIMACRAGARRLQELFERYGRAVVDAAFEECLEACAAGIRAYALPAIPDGTFACEDFVEINGAVAAEPRPFIRIRVALRKQGERLVFDFTGTDEQSPAAINVAGDRRYFVKYLMQIFRILVPDTVILNGGAIRVLDVVVPPGTILSPSFPAPCSYRAAALFRVPEVCLGALGKALGGKGAGGSDLRNPWRYRGACNGKPFLLPDGIGAGGGARPCGDGLDGVLGGVDGSSFPVEYMEAAFPIRVEEYGLAVDSAGPGERRGGFGIVKRCTMLADGSLWLFSDRLVLQPFGIGGGRAGRGARFVINPGTERENQITYKQTSIPIRAGDTLLIETPGGGGAGDPLNRDPQRVLQDVRRGTLTGRAAANDYGVVITDGAVDEAATRDRRATIRAARGPLPMIERGETFARLMASGRISLTTSDAC